MSLEKELEALDEGERASVMFAAQQDAVHAWANEVHLSGCECEQLAILLCAGLAKPPELVWEAPGALDEDVEAIAIRNPRTGARRIVFRGLGCTLLTLVHELVHCLRDWEEPHHDDVDWDLATILLEESRKYL